MSDGTPHASQQASAAIYPCGALVAEDRRGSRVGRVIKAWDECPPVLYKLASPHGGQPWFAWERDLRPATDAEAAAYGQHNMKRRAV